MSEQPRPRARDKLDSSLIWQIGVATLSRLFLSTARRFPYPFAPALSRGLGVPLTAVTRLIVSNQITGISGLFFAPLGDRWRYRVMLLTGLGLLGIGMLTGGFLPFYGPIMVALFLAGLGISVYNPAIQAYVGERVPYHRRGMAVGLIETCWAGSSLVGIPLVGLLIDRFGWRAPFFVLGALGLVSMVGLGLLIPGNRDGSKTSGALQSSHYGFWLRIKEFFGLNSIF